MFMALETEILEKKGVKPTPNRVLVLRAMLGAGNSAWTLTTYS